MREHRLIQKGRNERGKRERGNSANKNMEVNMGKSSSCILCDSDEIYDGMISKCQGEM